MNEQIPDLRAAIAKALRQTPVGAFDGVIGVTGAAASASDIAHLLEGPFVLDRGRPVYCVVRPIALSFRVLRDRTLGVEVELHWHEVPGAGAELEVVGVPV